MRVRVDRRNERWERIDDHTAVLCLGGARITITTAYGGPSPEQWWDDAWKAQRGEELERIAGRRLEAMAPGDRKRFAVGVLDDGSSSGGPRLMRFVRYCQNAEPCDWPDDIRQKVLYALACRAPPGKRVAVSALTPGRA